MIGKSEWFNLRKYGGWGINPKTWKGYAYSICVVLLIAGPQFIENGNKNIISIFFALVILIDVLDIMSKFKLDEREALHQAKAEKNASLTMVFVLSISIIYIAFKSINSGSINLEALIIIFLTLIVGYIAKIITYHKLEK
jgi:hypothetical protein